MGDIVQFLGGQTTVEETPQEPSIADFLNQPDTLGRTIEKGLATPPEKAARILQMQYKTGLPQDLIERNLDDLERESNKQGFNAETFRKNSPLLADWLAKNPNHVALAKNDIEGMSAIEKAWELTKWSGKSFAAAGPRFNAGAWGDVGEILDVLRLGETDLAKYAWAASGRQTKLAESLHGGEQGFARQAVGSGLESVGTTLLTWPFAIGRGPALALGVMGAQTAGTSFQQGKEAGKDPYTNLLFGTSQGAVEAGTEMISLGRFLKDLNVGSPFWKVLRNQILTENAGEQVATIAQDLNEWAVLHPEKPFSEYLAERPEAAASTFIATAVGVGLQTGVMHGAFKLADHRMRVAQSEQSEAFLRSLGENLNGSAILDKSPESVRDYIEHLKKDGDIQNIYVDVGAWDKLFQTQGEEVAKEVFGNADQYNEAKAVGGNIVIPLETYASKLAGTEYHNQLLPDLKLHIGDMTARERGVTSAEFEKVVQEDAAKIEEKYQEEAPIRKVYDDIYGQMLGIGATRTEAERIATLEGQRLAARAARIGVNPWDLYQENPLTLAREIPDVLRKKEADMTLDPLLDQLRAGKPISTKEMFGTSLTEFLKEKGGLQDQGGELSNMDVDAERKAFMKKLVQENGMTLDNAAKLAAENGYIDEADINKLLDAIDQETRGNLVYMMGKENQELMGRNQAINDLNDYLNSIGVDLSKMDNATADILFQSAFHGSPYKFDKFTLDHIGKGEGAQAYGWGLYFAGNREVAEFYRSNLASQEVFFNGKKAVTVREKFTNAQRTRIWDALRKDPSIKAMLDESSNYYGDINSVLDMYVRYAGDFSKVKDFYSEVSDYFKPRYEKILSALEGKLESKSKGQLYEVNIPDDDEYLFWDKPLSEQSEKVKAALGIATRDMAAEDALLKKAKGLGVDPTTLPEYEKLTKQMDQAGEASRDSGEFFYHRLSKEYGDEEAASKYLHSLGIAGIKYFDGSSRGAPYEVVLSTSKGEYARNQFDSKQAAEAYAEEKRGEGFIAKVQDNEKATYNYVIFDDRSIEILDTYYQTESNAPGGTAVPPPGGEAGVHLGMYSRSTNTITLLKKANPSTILHELGHSWLEELRLDAQRENAPQQIIDDWNTIKEWAKIGQTSANNFSEFRTSYVSKLPIDKYGYDEEVRSVADSIMQSWSMGNSDEVTRSFGPDEIYAKLHEENESEYFDADGDLTDEGSKRYGELEDNLAMDAARAYVGEPQQKEFDLHNPANMAKMLHAYLEATGFDVNAISGSGKSQSKYFEIMLPDGNVRIRIADHELPSEYADRESADEELKLYDISSDDVRADGRNISTGISEEDAISRADDFVSHLLKKYGTSNNEDTISVDSHEQFARGIEAYVMEGKSPSVELQTVFSRFKDWLVRIYKNLSALRVEVSPEVRDVFDRLLATDEQIERAREIQGYHKQLLGSEDMTSAEFDAYRKINEQAKQEASDAVRAKVMGELAREQTAWWKKEMSAMREIVAREIDAKPIYRAMQWLRKGVFSDGTAIDGMEHVKLSKNALVQRYGEAFLSRLPKPYVYQMEGGMHPDVAAELFGYDSGESLVKDLVEAKPRAELIEAETDARMREKYGDMMIDGSLADEADFQANNDRQADVFMFEMKVLQRKGSKRTVSPKEVFKSIAQSVIQSKTLADLDPRYYEMAARKAGQEAEKALLGKDMAMGTARNLDAAFDAKQRQLLNMYLYREAAAQKAAIEKAMDGFKALFKRDEKLAKTRNMDMVNAARAIAAQHGIGGSEEGAMFYLEQMREYDPETYEDMKDIVSMVASDSKPFKQLTVTEFGTVRDAIDGLWELSLRANQIMIEGKKIDRSVVVGELVEKMAEFKEPNARRGYDKAVTQWEKTKIGLLGFKAALRRVEPWVDAMDHGKFDGSFRKYIWQPISDATTHYREMRKGILEKYLVLLEPIQSRLTIDKINAPELGYMFGENGSGRSELLGALLHTGNESNLQKLLRGREWGAFREDGTLDTSRWDAFIKRMWDEGILTKVDYDFVQSVWDLHESLKPDAQKSHKEMYGYYFKEITAQPFVTPFGEYRGGYVPAIVDQFIADDAALRADKEALEKQSNGFMFPTTGRGFTKSRQAGYARPLAMDLRYTPQHLDKVLKFTYIETHVKDIGRLVMNKEFRNSLAAYVDSEVASEMLVPWLQRAAKQTVETASLSRYGRWGDKFWKEVRSRTGLQVMVLNVTNALQQFTGLSIAAIKVKPTFLAPALVRYVRAPMETASAIAEQSEFMRNRIATQSIEIQEKIDNILINPTGMEKARDFAIKHGYFMQAGTQHVVDLITWAGAYEQSIADGSDEKTAVRQADSAVRQTQGTFAPEDISRFETGTPFMRAFTMFYTYFNMQANLLGTEFSKAMEKGGFAGAGRGLYVYTFGFMIPAILSELLVQAFSGSLTDDDEEDLMDWLAIFFGGQVRTATAMVPGAGPALQSGINAWNDKWYDDRISTSPAVSMIESTVRAPFSIYNAIENEGSDKRAIKDTLTAVGMATGIPLAPLGRPLGYLADIEQGKTEPENAVDFARGLVSGKSQ